MAFEKVEVLGADGDCRVEHSTLLRVVAPLLIAGCNIDGENGVAGYNGNLVVVGLRDSLSAVAIAGGAWLGHGTVQCFFVDGSKAPL